MSLLIRIAQTRQGAERLVESRVFGCLAQSDFLAARPVTVPEYLREPPKHILVRYAFLQSMSRPRRFSAYCD